MPGIASHMVVAKLVGEKLKLNSDDFIRGNIMPDILLENCFLSHHKIKGKLYLVPDIKYWKDNLDFNDNKELAYFTHLLLDFYFLEDYVPEKVKNKNAFCDKSIYRDYDILNKKLLKRFDLDKKSIKRILTKTTENIDKKKLLYNLSCLDKNQDGKLKNLDEEDFSLFLINISQKRSEEIIEYASTPRKLSIHFRQ